MMTHYLSIAFRQLLKNKWYTAISVAGLGIGLASVFLIFQYLKLETSYDTFHKGHENIYRIVWGDDQTRTPYPMPLAMVRDFPEVENGTTLTPVFGYGLVRQTFSVRNIEKDIQYDESNVMAADSTFFDVFTFPLIKGDPKTILKNPAGVLLSEKTAKKYFGNDDPVGKHLAVNTDQNLVEILGVFKDIPVNSHFHFDILVPYLRMQAGDPGNDYYTWKDFGHYNYIKLKPGTDAKQLESRLMDWAPKYLDWPPEDFARLKKNHEGFRLQPIADIHLRSHLRWELESNGHYSYVYMMTAAALLILIIATLNFINLTTAQSTERAKEIGIRKSLGAFRAQLSGQFIGESLLIAAFGVIVAVILIEAALPFYNSFAQTPIVLHYTDFIYFLGGTGLLAGLLAGTYPALYLSMIKPGVILKGKFIQSPGGANFRKSFMIFQFFAAMVLISCSLIILDQLTFIKNKSLGFSEQELLVLPVKNHAIAARFDEVQAELLRVAGVESASATSNVPGKLFDQNRIFSATDLDQSVNASEVFVDYDFFKALNIPLKDGRTFLRENPADGKAFVINESAARAIFPGGAVGKEIIWDDEDGKVKGTVIGVVGDFHFQSLRDPVRPLLFIPKPVYNYVVIKIGTADFNKTISEIKSTWKKFDNRFDFEFSFLSDQLNQQYSTEQNMAAVLIFFASLAVLITCIGLLGIAALTFRQKTKEVSIRKVLGATIANIAALLLRNFTVLVMVAIIASVPVVWWMMDQWLRNFTYHVNVNPVIFVISGVVLIAVTWGTLSYLTLKIAKVNPAETLRSE